MNSLESLMGIERTGIPADSAMRDDPYVAINAGR